MTRNSWRSWGFWPFRKATGAVNRSIHELIKKGLIEYTIKNKPNSRLQKYRLTERGKQVAQGLTNYGVW